MISKKQSTKIKPSVTFKIRKINNILQEPNEDLPFDGFATKNKEIHVSNFFKYDKHFKEKKQNNLFNKPYPLINVISNRKAVNNSSSFLKHLLSHDDIIYDINYDEKVRTMKKYNNRIRIIKQNMDLNVFHEKSKEKAFKKVKDCLSVTSNSIWKNENYRKKNNKDTNLFFKLRQQYRNKHLREYMVHSLNNEYLRNKVKYNYVRDAYKTLKSDKLINNIQKDLLTYKYNKHLRLFTTIYK